MPITADGPHLEGVLGPLSAEDEAAARRLVLEASGRLAAVEGWHGSGIVLDLVTSGQVSLHADLASSARRVVVEMVVGLQPGWFHGERSATPSWTVEREVYVDCQHEPDHGGMDLVESEEHEMATPIDAVRALVRVVDEGVARLLERPIDEWTEVGGQAV